MVAKEVTAQDRENRAAIEKILQSQVFRGTESLRRLLRFLADKTLAGEADHLKEYSVGVDAFGKPPNYDPRQDSAVRIQVSRLRQKLAEYYATEGKDDETIVELPKGGFRVQFETRPAPGKHQTAVVVPPPTVTPAPAEATPARNRFLVPVLAGCLAISLVWAGWLTVRLSSERTFAEPAHAAWTPALEELWAPFTQGNRHLLVAVAAPLTVGIEGHGYYRDTALNRWEDVLQDPGVKALQRQLNNAEIFPHRSTTGIGDANAAFLLGKLFGTRAVVTSFARTSDLSWQQMSDANTILLGTPRNLNELLKGMPAEPRMSLEPRGLHILKSANGEPEYLEDQMPNARRSPTAPDDGQVYALVTRVPGPNGTGTVAGFSSHLNSGTLAAVQWFTDPALAETVVAKLRGDTGKVPPYFQMALKVRFKGGVPTETSYVTHRILQSTVGAAPR